MWNAWALEHGVLCHPDGIIRSPGKFEGQMVYVPYFWERSLEWGLPYDSSVSVPVSAEDRRKFAPLLRKRRAVRMREDDQGFVGEL